MLGTCLYLYRNCYWSSSQCQIEFVNLIKKLFHVTIHCLRRSIGFCINSKQTSRPIFGRALLLFALCYFLYAFIIFNQFTNKSIIFGSKIYGTENSTISLFHPLMHYGIFFCICGNYVDEGKSVRCWKSQKALENLKKKDYLSTFPLVKMTIWQTQS